MNKVEKLIELEKELFSRKICLNEEERDSQRFDNNKRPNEKLLRWRMKERLKTVHVALVLCLNIGVDPPDVVKVQPCAKLECWTDPFSLPSQKALETIGNNLKAQYERWQPRARYKQCLDPTVDEVKKTCVQLRRSAKDERVLFHYNGHGVPRPTANSEIWVFNKNYTQYIPLSIYDLNLWMGSPSIYVFDCNSAGLIMNAFVQIAQQKDQEFDFQVRHVKTSISSNDSGSQKSRESIMLASCGENETLPMNPEFPADLFTSCLTTPIKTALKWFCQHNRLLNGITPDMLEDIPGKINDRRSPLGELNWIFTAITDTIAWNVLPRSLFQRLFRQDLLVASLFRNFLLAERIMRMVNCTPVSYPKLPSTHNHPMWQAWDLAVDMCLSQIPTLMTDPSAEFVYSEFFAEQLTAFEVWLDFGHEKKKPPEQLPIVLQVLLSQVHRLRALTLLARFLDMGPWAINLALSVGIFPYVLKLLQSHAADLRQVLVFIWTKILSLDKTCQNDLVKDNGHLYFISVLSNPSVDADQKAMTCFILSVICDHYPMGQQACFKQNLLQICVSQLKDENPLLRRWLCLCIAKVLEGADEYKTVALQDNIHEEIMCLLADEYPEVRTAAVYALHAFVDCDHDKTEERKQCELKMATSLLQVISDGSPLVRREAMFFLAVIFKKYYGYVNPRLLRGIISEDAKIYEAQASLDMESGSRSPISTSKKLAPPKSPRKLMMRNFSVAKSLILNQSIDFDVKGSPASTSEIMITNDIDYDDSNSNINDNDSSRSTALDPKSFILLDLCRVILIMSRDPMPEVREAALTVLDYIKGVVLRDPFKKLSTSIRKTMSLTDISNTHMSESRSLFMRTDSENHLDSPNNDFNRERRLSENNENSGNQDNVVTPPTDHIINSTFYEWSCSHFSKPLLPETKLSPDVSLTYRSARNEKIMRDALSSYNNVAIKKFEDQIGILGNDTDFVTVMKFHPFEPLLLVADERDGISVWNWEEGVRNNVFYCGKKIDGRITSLNIINEHTNSLLALTSSAGQVCIYKDYSYGFHSEQLVTAFKALSVTPSPNTLGPGVVAQWQHTTSQLFVGGGLEYIKVWNLDRELCVQDISLEADTFVTSMAVDRTGGDLLVTGCSDGSLRIFDTRMDPAKHGLVATFNEHKNWIVDVHMQKIDPNFIISGCANGEIKFWDYRMAGMGGNLGTSPGVNTPSVGGSVRTIESHRSSMNALAVHDYAPILASGSNNQFIQVFNTSGETLSMIYYHDGFLGQRIGPVSCLCFHPFRMYLAAGATDSIISIYSSDSNSRA